MKLLHCILSFVLLSVMVFAWPAQVVSAEKDADKKGKTYYISSSAGDDKNDGLSSKKPWKTFKNAAGLRLTGGDRVLLKRGDTWKERLEINAPNGTKDAWVYIGPYGDLKASAPVIDLNADDNMDDICVLVQDCVPEVKRRCNYVWIDNLTLKNAVLGIYFRYNATDNNEGVRVTDCYFENMRSLEWDSWIAENGKVATHDANLEILKKPKGNLPYIGSLNGLEGKYYKTGGGVNEYFTAAAIRIGGVPAADNYLVSNIEMERLIFTNCASGIESCGFWTLTDWVHTKNWNIKDIYTASGSLFWLDCVDCGWDGTPDSQWGIFENLICDGSIIDSIAMNGVTIAGLVTSKNCLIRNSIMNNCKNNDFPDGCGFDFERNNINVQIENSIFANNDGQGVLMMQEQSMRNGELYTSPNIDCKVSNCLFYNNLQNPFEDIFAYDFLIWNDNNENIEISDNYFVFKPVLEKWNVLANATDYLADEEDYEVAFAGPMRQGVSFHDNDYQRGNELMSYEGAVNRLDLEYVTRYRVNLIETNEETCLDNIEKVRVKAQVVEMPGKNNPSVVKWFVISAIVSGVFLLFAAFLVVFTLIKRKG